MVFKNNEKVIKIIGVFLFLVFSFLLGNFFQKNGEAWLAPQGNPPEGNIEFMKSCRWAIFDGSIVPPQSLSIQPLSLTTARIIWSPLPGMYSYKISVSQLEGGPYVEVDSVLHPTEQYEVGGLLSGSTYYFVVQSSTDGSVWSEYSDEVSLAMPVTPDSPTNLTSSIYSETAIDLSWTAPVNNGGADITGYKIERNNGGGWVTVLESTGTTTTTYRDSGLTENTEYSHRVSTVTVAPSDPTLASTKYTGHCYTTTADCASGYTSILGGTQSGCATVGPVSSPYTGSGNNRYRIIATNADPASCGSCLSSNPSYDQVRQAQVSLDSGTNYTGVGSSLTCRTQRSGSTCMWWRYSQYENTSGSCRAHTQATAPCTLQYPKCPACGGWCSCASSGCSSCSTIRNCANASTTIRWCCRN